LWSVSNCHHGWKLYLEFIFFAFGVYASRINTALIGITLLLLMRRTQRCTILKMRPYMIVIGVLTPGLLVLVMLTVIKNEVEPHGDKTDPNFQYGMTQAMVSLILLSWSFLTTILSLIIGQRSSRRFNEPVSRSNSEDDPSRYLLEDAIVENSEALVEEIEDLSGPPSSGCSSTCRARVGAGRYRCDSEQRDYNSSLLERYAVPPAREAMEPLEDEVNDNMDLIKHTILLLCLCCSMFVGIAICLWTLVMEKMTGIYIELLFLDGFLNFGQGLFTSALFLLGLNMVSRTRQKPKGSVWIAPVILIITKTIVMPLIAREIVSTFNVGANATATQEWSSFAFLYGTFPPAPGAFVYAVKYDVNNF